MAHHMKIAMEKNQAEEKTGGLTFSISESGMMY